MRDGELTGVNDIVDYVARNLCLLDKEGENIYWGWNVLTETSLGPARFDPPASANSAKGMNAAGNSTRRLSGMTMLNPDIEIVPPRFVAEPDLADALHVLSVKVRFKLRGKTSPVEEPSNCKRLYLSQCPLNEYSQKE